MFSNTTSPSRQEISTPVRRYASSRLSSVSSLSPILKPNGDVLTSNSRKLAPLKLMAEYDQIYSIFLKFRSMASGVSLREVTYQNKLIQNCFTGADAVTWLMKEEKQMIKAKIVANRHGEMEEIIEKPVSKEEMRICAKEFLQYFVELKMIIDVTNETNKNFFNEQRIYIFSLEDTFGEFGQKQEDYKVYVDIFTKQIRDFVKLFDQNTSEIPAPVLQYYKRKVATLFHNKDNTIPFKTIPFQGSIYSNVLSGDEAITQMQNLCYLSRDLCKSMLNKLLHFKHIECLNEAFLAEDFMDSQAVNYCFILNEEQKYL